MAEYLIYWKNYRKDGDDYDLGTDNPLSDWRTNCGWLKKAFRPGDRFWFVTAGELCGGSIPTAAYLVGTFVASAMPTNQDDDGNYPADQFRYTIEAADGTPRYLDPILVDDVVRSPDSTLPLTAHIGRTMQGPRRVAEDKVAEFERRMRMQSSRTGHR